MIKIGFNTAGEQMNTNLTTQSESEDALLDVYPTIVEFRELDHGDLINKRRPLTLVGGVITEAPPPTEEELAAIRLDQLKLYTEESGLRHGCGILDPLTGEPSGDSNAPIGVIRQQTGQARNHLVYLKLDGTEAQKVSAGNCQAVEENLSLVVAQTILAVQAGTITTKVEIDEIINAVNLSYT